jgi:eukaryotic-like serine/threonine-protein kinase
MSADRQRQVTELCHAALVRTASERGAFLREACAGDAALRQEVESLLRYEDAADRFMERPAVEEVARLVSHHEPNVDLAGRRLGVYQIEARIGAGGMGEVYRARDTKLGRAVAIKSCPAHSPAVPIAGCGSSAKRVCSRRSTIPTSHKCTASKRPTRSRHS